MKTYKRIFGKDRDRAGRFQDEKRTIGFNTGATLSRRNGWTVYWSPGFVKTRSAIEA
jgi:hypothetical protein